MEVFRITNCEFIHDMTGSGAALYGGRWNSEGVYVLYTAATASLAMLETLAHLKVLPRNAAYCLACFEIPDQEIQEVDETKLPKDWNVFPAPVTLRDIGNRFIRSAHLLALRLPSAILPEEKIVLLNPKHPIFKEIKVKYTRPIDIDQRLYKY